MKNKVLKQTVTIFSIVFSIIVVVVFATRGLLGGYIDRMQLEDDSGEISVVYSIPPEPEILDSSAVSQTGPDISSAVETETERLEKELREYAENDVTIKSDKNVMNILLIGNDTREKGGAGRSDAIILLSIDKAAKRLIITSFVRDIYLYIPVVERYNRVNASFAYGSSRLLVQTIEQNFKIKIDKYMMTDFFTFTDFVDLIGGVDVNVQEAELTDLNNAIHDNYKMLTGSDAPADKILPSAGMYTLDGIQTLSHVRNRRDSVFNRSRRQRDVINQMYLKLRQKNVFELESILLETLPNIKTNFTREELLSLIASIPEVTGYEVVQSNIPVTGSYKSQTISKMAVITVDLEKNTKALWSLIYND